MDKESLARRIIHDVNHIFKKDITEFDLIPVIDNQENKSPIVLVGTKLGIESWCIKTVYEYSYKAFLSLRINGANSNDINMVDLTRILLLLNPDLGTAWNCRKQLVLDNVLETRDELKFTEIVLTRKPKSPDTFSHRQWSLRHMLNTGLSITDDMIAKEYEICTKAATKYERNYYSWTHRIWILITLVPDHKQLDTIFHELQSTIKWFEGHVSDYSCLSYRQTIVSKLFGLCIKVNYPMEEDMDTDHQDKNCNFDTLESVLVTELDFINRLINGLYPDKESIFMHRRFLLKAVHLLYRGTTNDGHKLLKIQSDELNLIQTILKTNPNTTNNGWRIRLMERHVDWIKRTFNWTVQV